MKIKVFTAMLLAGLCLGVLNNVNNVFGGSSDVVMAKAHKKNNKHVTNRHRYRIEDIFGEENAEYWMNSHDYKIVSVSTTGSHYCITYQD